MRWGGAQRLQELSDDEEEMEDDTFGGGYRAQDAEARPSPVSHRSLLQEQHTHRGSWFRPLSTRRHPRVELRLQLTRMVLAGGEGVAGFITTVSRE